MSISDDFFHVAISMFPAIVHLIPASSCSSLSSRLRLLSLVSLSFVLLSLVLLSFVLFMLLFDLFMFSCFVHIYSLVLFMFSFVLFMFLFCFVHVYISLVLRSLLLLRVSFFYCFSTRF